MKSMSGKYVCRIRVPPPLGLPGQKGFRVQEQDPHGLVDVVILSVIDPSSHFHIGDVVDFKLDKTHDTALAEWHPFVPGCIICNKSNDYRSKGRRRR